MAKFTRDDVDKFYDYDIDLPHRTIYVGSINSDIDGDESGTDVLMAERVIKALHLLGQKDEPITIIMNNLGGDWYHGMAIYDAIKTCNCHITIKAYGYCMSMGSVILQAADERLMAPNAKMMIHYGSNAAPSIHSKIFDSWAEENKKINTAMEDIYLDKIKLVNPSFTRQDLEKKLNFDTFLTAEEAVKLGLADDIL
jgi:ATP-dependent Clp protease, protease subunit